MQTLGKLRVLILKKYSQPLECSSYENKATVEMQLHMRERKSKLFACGVDLKRNSHKRRSVEDDVLGT